LDLQLYVQSVHITIKVVSSNPVRCSAYSIQHYVIKVVIDLRLVGGFLRRTPVSSTNKTDHHDITENIVESDVKYHNPYPFPFLSSIVIDCSNRVGGIIVIALFSIAVVRGFEPRSGQSNDYIIGTSICCLSVKNAAGTKTCWPLVRNQDNVSE